MNRDDGVYAYLFDDIPNDWDLRPFEKAVDFQEGPGILAKDFRPTGVPLLRLSCLDDNTTTLNGCNFLDPKMVNGKWSHFRLHAGDILLSSSGTLGRSSILAKDHEGSICYTGIIRMRPRDENVTYGFIRYFLMSPYFKWQIGGSSTGSVLQHFGPTHLKEMSFPVPPEAEQKAMVEILSSLDEKIELNRKQNRTLETIVQALFKRWLVEFEFPDENGQPYKSSGGEMQPSDLGGIPVAWEVKPLDQIADYLNGLALQNFPPDGVEYLPVIKIREMKQGVTKDSDRASTKIDPKYIVDDGDVLFSWSGSLEVDIWCQGKGALNQHLFKVTSNTYPKWFYYLWTKHHLRAFQAAAADKATTMGHIQRSHLSDALSVCPPSDLLSGFSETFVPLIEKIIATRVESRTLARLRDALLPKLISGELRVV